MRRIKRFALAALVIILVLLFGLWLVQKPGAPTFSFLEDAKQTDQFQLPAKYGGIRLTVYEFEGDFDKMMNRVMAELNTHPELEGSLFPQNWGVGYHNQDVDIQVVRGTFRSLKDQFEEVMAREDLKNPRKRDIADAMMWRENKRKFSIIIKELKPDAIRKLVGDINKATGDKF